MTIDKKTVLDAWHRIDSGAHVLGRVNGLTVRMTYLLATLMVCAISAADYFTGIELMMSPMYAFPCILMDWRIGRTPALLFAVVVTAVQWFVGTFGGRTYSNPHYLYWDIVLNIVFYGALIWVLAKLRLALEMERVLSRVDFLTRLNNRKSLAEALRSEVQRSRRYGNSLCILTVDCLHLGDFNDKRGHSTGDLLLQAVADALQHKFRSTDLISRSGDEEFMVVLPDTTADAMTSILAGLHRHLEQLMLLRGGA